MQILIIEDEISVSQYLSDGLKKEGYGIQSCASIEEIESLLSIKDAVEPDVIIMDRLLNGFDTATKLPSIKQKWPRSAVLVLSAIGGPSDKSRLLDTGADDYMSKPFSIEELSSRIRVLIRRQSSSVEKGLALGNTRDEKRELKLRGKIRRLLKRVRAANGNTESGEEQQNHKPLYTLEAIKNWL